MPSQSQPQSPSMVQPDYWWYRGRSEMLQAIVEPELGDPRLVLDVGSADGPSVSWMRGRGKRVAIDLDREALGPGDVSGSALQLPFRDESFDVVTAFDVLEHCEPETQAMSELARVLEPGGRIFLAVPAYQWAWTSFDRDIGHYRRYTRGRLIAAIEGMKLTVERATYMFAGTFPIFAIDRLSRKVRHIDQSRTTTLPRTPALVERMLLGLCRADRRLLTTCDLPFGSSVMAIARKPVR